MKDFNKLTTDEKLNVIYRMLMNLGYQLENHTETLDKISRQTYKIDKIIRQNDYIINA